jgi:fumarylacetoacetase
MVLESFIDMDREKISALRQVAYNLLVDSSSVLRDNKTLRKKVMIPMDEANLQVPIPPMAYVDFYSGIYHASNVGQMFRPNQPPLLPNYKWVPIGYNGRANTVIASGTPIVRPKGQIKVGENDPVYEATRELDFELEMGFYVGHGQPMGSRITCTQAEEHILGLVIVNDWSSRDVQRWEYQPLGPFLAKTFATSISPWIVTLDALEPFRVPGMEQDPEPLPYLRQKGNTAFDVELEVRLQTAKMQKPQVISRSNMKHLYWSLAQQLAHQTSNGTPVELGDLYASGTISGPTPDSCGSMLELSWKGERPIVMQESGEERTFLQDGDTLTLAAWGQGDGFRVGFGEVVGTVIGAK